MESSTAFSSMVERLRAGDQDAVRQFVATYEPFIRRTIRRRLARTPLQAVADSVDVCQSAMGSFLIRAAAGQFTLRVTSDLEKLLLTIARRKLAALLRHESAGRRDRRRQRAWDSAAINAVDLQQDPVRALANTELLNQVEETLADDERVLFQLRRQGHDWETIARRLNEPSLLLRKRLSRAIRRVAAELGLDEMQDS
jgi:RNA polymerase sigma-70 factor (ECF subfamily)